MHSGFGGGVVHTSAKDGSTEALANGVQNALKLIINAKHFFIIVSLEHVFAVWFLKGTDVVFI